MYRLAGLTLLAEPIAAHLTTARYHPRHARRTPAPSGKLPTTVTVIALLLVAGFSVRSPA